MKSKKYVCSSDPAFCSGTKGTYPLNPHGQFSLTDKVTVQYAEYGVVYFFVGVSGYLLRR